MRTLFNLTSYVIESSYCLDAASMSEIVTFRVDRRYFYDVYDDVVHGSRRSVRFRCYYNPAFPVIR